MRIRLSQLKRIIKEEVARIMEADGGLEITSAEYETDYNDPDTSTSQCTIEVEGTCGGQEFKTFVVFFDFSQSEDVVLERLAENISEECGAEVSPDDVKKALGPKLKEIMDSLEEDNESYRGGGSGGFGY